MDEGKRLVRGFPDGTGGEADEENGADGRSKGYKKEILETVEAIVFAVVFVVFLFTFFFRIVGVEGPSMNPTVYENDRVIISHLFYTPQVGDIVVINHPESFSIPIIKRIIAVEGDEIFINEATGEVFVNDNLIEEPYINELTKITHPDVTYPFTVSEGHVFVMGDNRMHSTDSREIGEINVNEILGRAVFRIFPFDSFGKL